MWSSRALAGLLALVAVAEATWTTSPPTWCGTTFAADASCADSPDCCDDRLPCMAQAGSTSTATCTSTCSHDSCVRLDSHGLADPYKIAGYATIEDDNMTSLTVTGGYGGTFYNVNSTDELTTALADTGATVIMISGDLDNSDSPSISLTVNGDTTIYGDLDDPATLKNVQLMVVGDNVIIQNIAITEVVAVAVKASNGTTLISEGTGNDGIVLNGAQGVWIDHCEFSSQLWPADLYDISGDQVINQTDAELFYGNAISVSNGAAWITVSYCDFHDHWEVMVIGDSDSQDVAADTRITVHHNYFHDIGFMAPLLVYGIAHHYNNYFAGTTMAIETVLEVQSNGTALVEGNYVDNATDVFVSSSSDAGNLNFGENTLENVAQTDFEANSSFNVPYSYDIDPSAVLADRLPYLVGVGKLTEDVLAADVENLLDEEDDNTLKRYADGYASENGGTTGGSLGKVTVVDTGLAINTALCSQTGNEPIILLVNGTITLNNTEAVSGCNTSDTEILIAGRSNITIIGAEDTGAVFRQVGISIADSSNIIIRNLYITDVMGAPGYPQSNDGNAISMEGTVSNVWVDHCTIRQYGDENRGYQACIAIGASVTYVTVSYTAFENAGEGVVAEGSEVYLTLHHNYFWYVTETTLELAGGLAHAYNNLVVGAEEYVVSVCASGSAKVDYNYFYSSLNPVGSFCDGDGAWDVSDNEYDGSSWAAIKDGDVLGDGGSTVNITVPYDYFADDENCTMASVIATAGSGASLRVASGFCRVMGNPSDVTIAVESPYSAKPAETTYTNDPNRQMADGFATLGSGTTGGDGGDVEIVETGTELLAAICARDAVDSPITLWVDGVITHDNTDITEAAKAGTSCTLVSGAISLVGVSSISILGFTALGGSAYFEEIGLYLSNASNIILQNLNISDVKGAPGYPVSNDGAAVRMENSVSNVWIDHCTLEAGGDSTRGYNGLVVMENGVQYVTVSYTALLDSGEGGNIGASTSDTTTGSVTFHHNYYWYVTEDTPAVAAGTLHAYNNYYVGITESGINVLSAASAKVDANYFQDSTNVLGTFGDSTAAGAWEVSSNVYDNITWALSESGDTLAGSNTSEPTSTTTVTLGYSYTAQTSSCIPTVVLGSAGAMRGLIYGTDAQCSLSGTATGSLPDPADMPETTLYSLHQNRDVEGYASLNGGTTGGDNGDVFIVSTVDGVMSAICARDARDTPVTIFIEGELTEASAGQSTSETTDMGACTVYSEGISLVNVSNITIHGLGAGANLSGVGIRIEDAYNIIIQSVNITDVSLAMDGTGVYVADSSNVWIDHVNVEAVSADATQLGGLIEIVNSTYVTVSYSTFSYAAESCALSAGGAETTVTVHHNDFTDVAGCGFSVEGGMVHFFNNLFADQTVVGINVGGSSMALIDFNVFYYMVNPWGAVGVSAGSWDTNRNWVASNVSWTSFSATDVLGSDVPASAEIEVPYTYMVDFSDCLPEIIVSMAGPLTDGAVTEYPCTYNDTSAPDTLAPPTPAPSTSAPATQAPPTTAPPTSIPPTLAPGTTLPPPTNAPPTNAPPTNAPPTKAPPTKAPSTDAPATKAPPTPQPAGTPKTPVPTPAPTTTTTTPTVAPTPAPGTPATPTPTTVSPSTPSTPIPSTPSPSTPRDLTTPVPATIVPGSTPAPTSGNKFKTGISFIVDLLVTELKDVANRLIAKLASLFNGAAFTFVEACSTDLTTGVKNCHAAEDLSRVMAALQSGNTAWEFVFTVLQDDLGTTDMSSLESTLSAAGGELAGEVSADATFSGVSVEEELTPAPVVASESDDDLSESGIAAIVIGCVLFVGCIVAVVLFFLYGAEEPMPSAIGETEPVAEEPEPAVMSSEPIDTTA